MRRLLIVGCGDVALRMVAHLRQRYRIYALTHSRERMLQLRQNGIVPLLGDLDDGASLKRLAGIAHDVVHSAPPPRQGTHDMRTKNLVATLAQSKSLPQRLIYISTSGVYGDCHGECVYETRPLHPVTERAQRRVDAERRLRDWGRRSGVRISLVRAPGIYSRQRLPLKRLAAGVPAFVAEDDSYTNHIHAEDLAAIVIGALRRGAAGRAYNASDDSEIKLGDYFDLLADRFNLPRPPRIPRAGASQQIPRQTLSFMNESRRLSNRRIKKELRVRLSYPTVRHALQEVKSDR